MTKMPRGDNVKRITHLPEDGLKVMLKTLEDKFGLRLYYRYPHKNEKPIEDDLSWTPSERLIRRLGGGVKVGKALGIRSQAISHWMAKNCIPVERLPTLIRMAKEKGIPVDPKELRSDIDWEALK